MFWIFSDRLGHPFSLLRSADKKKIGMGRGYAEYIPVHSKHTYGQVTSTFLTLHSSLVLLFPVPNF